jgi:hypothetical protein
MKRLLILLLVVVLVGVAAILALIAFDSPPGSENRPDGTSIHIVNNSSQTICSVQATRISDDGSLKASTFDSREIAAGKWLYYQVDAGNYDLAALNCGGTLLEDAHNVAIAGTYTWAITD